MYKLYSYLFICLLYLNVASALDSADRDTIQDIIKGYTIAWNDHAGKGFGEGFAVDADFVNIFGMHFSGKEEIEIRHIKILQAFLKDSKMQILNTTLREVQPGLVIGVVKWKVEGFRQPGSDMSLPGISREGIFTQVFVKREHQWEITASQNTLIPN
jgi:uncharacterized protein (TIGR02246 family)